MDDVKQDWSFIDKWFDDYGYRRNKKYTISHT